MEPKIRITKTVDLATLDIEKMNRAYEKLRKTLDEQQSKFPSVSDLLKRLMQSPEWEEHKKTQQAFEAFHQKVHGFEMERKLQFQRPYYDPMIPLNIDRFAGVAKQAEPPQKKSNRKIGFQRTPVIDSGRPKTRRQAGFRRESL
ncbi:MAG: hypothetical protein ACM3YF_07355 [Candidatus Zixiibacteriota bacterium]